MSSDDSVERMNADAPAVIGQPALVIAALAILRVRKRV